MLEFKMVSGQVITVLVNEPEKMIGHIYEKFGSNEFLKFNNLNSIINLSNVESIGIVNE